MLYQIMIKKDDDASKPYTPSGKRGCFTKMMKTYQKMKESGIVFILCQGVK